MPLKVAQSAQPKKRQEEKKSAHSILKIAKKRKNVI